MVVRGRVLGQWAGVWTGGGGSSSAHSPHCSLHSSGDAGGYMVGGDVEDGLPCREHQVLMHGMARNSLFSEMLPTMAYRHSPYSPEKEDRL